MNYFDNIVISTPKNGDNLPSLQIATLGKKSFASNDPVLDHAAISPTVDAAAAEVVGFTCITTTKPDTVSKEIFLNSDGSLGKKTTAQVSEGKMEVVQVNGLSGFASFLAGLKTDQCCAYGVPPYSPVKLVTQAVWDALGHPEGMLPRTDKTMHWSSGPGIVMLDYDAPKDGSPAMTRDELVAAVRDAAPGLADVTLLWWPSTSSCIFHGDKELVGIRGQRLYFAVADARDIPRTLSVINELCWAKGIGRFEVSKSGSLLERGLFDGSVAQPNRIDFAAGAKCHDGLVQKRGEPVLIPGWVEYVDSRQVVTEPTHAERSAAIANKSKARNALRSEAEKVRAKWVADRCAELIKAFPEMPESTAMDTAQCAVENRTLMGDWRLNVVKDGVGLNLSVNDVLDMPDEYHGCKTLDPLEPDYDGGRPVGKLYLRGVRPCLHSLAHGGVTFKLVRQRIDVEVAKGKEHESINAVLDVLRDSPEVYDFGGVLVSIADDGVLFPLDEHSLRYLVGGMIQFFRWVMVDGEYVKSPEDPPQRVLKCVLALGRNRKLKPLDAVITAPILRKDGSVVHKPGYDPASHLFLALDSSYLPAIPMAPTAEQAKAALERLLKPFKDFPIVSPLHWAVLLAAILTAAVRAMLKTAPAFAFDAPVQASGKTLLAMCMAILASGVDPSILPHTAGRTDEETRKRLFSMLLSGKRVLIWDNVTGTFDSAAMASLLTSPEYQDRVLGKSESPTVPNRMLMLLTGNNMTLTGDMVRRVLTARIDPETDAPFARIFDLEPASYCLGHRQEMIADALTLIRFYLSSGVKRPGKGRMASFEQWDDWVRQTVIFIEREIAPGQFGDIMEQVEENQSLDSEQESLGELLHAWLNLFGKDWKSASEVLDACQHGNTLFPSDTEKALINALHDFHPGKEISSKSLGKILKYRKGRIVDGLRLVQSMGDNKTSVWMVEEVSVKTKTK